MPPVSGGEDSTQGGLIESTKIRDPLVGQKLDDYEIQSFIGEGAMGIVYRALHTVIGKPAAIKVLRPDYADDPEMVSRLIREARTVNAIRHPSIVDIFGFGQVKATGQPYIVMDLLEGEPLDMVIREKAPMPFADAFDILDDLLGALAAAHAVGVIHRDLKPGNIILEKQPEGRAKVKLLDFGLAKQADKANGSVRPTNPGTILGTPAFMAPEQIRGEKTSPATDLYAVGGIAYQLVTGHLPHEGSNAIEIVSAKLKADPPRPKTWNPRLEEALDTFIVSLLNRDVNLRPQSADEVRKALKRIFEARAVSPTGSSGSHSAFTPTPKADAPKGSTGSNPVFRSGGGVVPKRGWNDASTQAPTDDHEQHTDGTTDGFASPYQKTAEHEPLPVPRPSASSEPTYVDDGETPRGVPSVAASVATQPAVAVKPREESRPALAPIPPRIAALANDATPVGSLAVAPLARPAPKPRPENLSVPRSKLPLVLVGVAVLLAVALGIFALVK